MTARAVNLAIFALILVEVASGIGSLLVGSPGGAWVFWIHSTAGLTLVVLLAWKWRIVVRSFARRGAGLWAAAPTLLGVLFLATLATGLLWATVGLPRILIPGYGMTPGITLHVVLALLLLPPFALHAILRWHRPRRVDFASRRAALRTIGLGAAGVVSWQALEAVTSLTSLPGADRRFTGSHQKGSFSGNDFPRTNWFSDSTQRIDESTWHLRIHGRVERESDLAYDDFRPETKKRSTLDCTGGWYTVQDWTGVPLAALLDSARVDDGARTVIVRSRTGYNRRFPLDDAGRLLLATHVGGERLSPGHGFPIRLVADGYRGYNWVKWVTEIEVSDEPSWWQPPLPLQ
jgi:DMSO/TMAO reductase YedYZ molybdopterin-dependent catalytic subunit